MFVPCLLPLVCTPDRASSTQINFTQTKSTSECSNVSWVAFDQAGQMWGSSSALQCRCGGGVNVGAHRLLPLHCHRSHHSGGGRDGSIQSRLCWDSGVVDVLSSSRGERSWETATASCNGEGQGERKKLLGGVKERLKNILFRFYERSISMFG